MDVETQQQDQPTTILPDSEEIDSVLGTESQSSLTQSLRSSLLESVRENGRGYHRYKSGAGSDYPLPEDEGEQDRLNLQHEMFLRTFNGKLYLSPLKDVRDVLDLGTGTGIWAMDYADEHPEATVTGTDLSAIQPTYVPPNCKFEVDDFNSEWTFGSEQFDFIHARGMCGCSKDYPALIRQSYDALRPGGWLEMPDVQMPFLDDDGTMKGTKLEEWSDLQVESCAKIGIDTTAPSKYKQWMIEQGFEDVTELKFKWPTGTWPKDKQYKDLGKLTRINFLSGIEGFSLRLWTGVLGMSYEEVMDSVVEVKKDVANPKIHSYWPV